ncbi:protein-disulfide isomerase [Rubricella aquisinus]|uniref:Protein-disulfide isomerase n=1 Tax=Rubricella aquisinus TaxID=2028108 RepID=A0A840WI12_9RHOB|nr:DsbA family protein [Rubricella aquisinus]MBB5514759.1 protein-disulfide isomerase [Rubricella aquisinus]
MSNTITGLVAIGILGVAALGAYSAQNLPAPATPDVPVVTQTAALPQPAVSAPITEDRQRLDAEFRRYLLQNPEIMVEVFDLLEARQRIAAEAAETDMVRAEARALYDDGFSYVGGNPDGAITIVEFVDYKCGFCKRAHPEMVQLVANNDDIRFIRKEFPILGAESVMASRAALSVLETAGPEVYDTFSDRVMRFGGPINEQVLTRIAEQSGADAQAMLDMMDSQTITDRITATRALGQRLDISGTPTFIFGETMVRGYIPLETMEETLARLRRIQQ